MDPGKGRAAEGRIESVKESRGDTWNRLRMRCIHCDLEIRVTGIDCRIVMAVVECGFCGLEQERDVLEKDREAEGS